MLPRNDLVMIVWPYQIRLAPYGRVFTTLLGSKAIDLTRADPETLAFGPAGAAPANARRGRARPRPAAQEAAHHQESHSHLQLDPANRSGGCRLVAGRDGDGRADEESRR